MMRDPHRLHPALSQFPASNDAPERDNLRARLATIADWAINMIDAIDGDPDAEFETDFDLNPISLQSVDRVPAKRVTMRRAA